MKAKNRLLCVLLCLVLGLGLGLLPSFGITAAAEGSTYTWDSSFLKKVNAYHEAESDLIVQYNNSNGGITVDFEGGRDKYTSGLYNTNTTNLLFIGDDSVLTFSSANYPLSKIVIRYRERPALTDNYDQFVGVNNGRWTKEDRSQNGEHYLTLSGPASYHVTLTYGLSASTWKLGDIVSISFTSADPYVYTVQEGITASYARDGGLEFTSSAPFVMKQNGAFLDLPEQSGGTYTYWADPKSEINAEKIIDNTLTVYDEASFRRTLEKGYISKIVLGDNLALTDSFTVSNSQQIDLNGKTLSCTAADKAINYERGYASFSDSVGGGLVTGFTSLTEWNFGNMTIYSGRFDLPLGIIEHSGRQFPSTTIKAGFFKLYDTFTRDDLDRYIAFEAAIRVDDSGWAEVYYHQHDVVFSMYDNDEGGITVVEDCVSCGKRTYSGSLSQAQVARLVELNGGAFTPSWAWDVNDPGHARLTLKISSDTYKAAEAEGMDYSVLWRIYSTGLSLTADDVVHTEHCGEYRTSIPYHGYTYVGVFNDPSDPHQIETIFDWDYDEATKVYSLKSAYRACTKCVYRLEPYRTYTSDHHVDATYTSEEKHIYSASASYNDPYLMDFTDEKVVILAPAMPIVHHPAVAPTCEEDGSREYWHDEVNNRYFDNATGDPA